MTTLYYQSDSKGPQLISDMEYWHLYNSAKKLRANCPPHREDELAAMDEALVWKKAERRAKLVAELETTADFERAEKIRETIAKMDAEA